MKRENIDKCLFTGTSGRLRQQWGRLTSVSKQADGQTLKKIADYSYTELSQLKIKSLGNGLETQNLDYNIQGNLSGINKDYARANNNNNWFGEEINYDYGFTQNQLDGNIAGIKWRSKGDGEQRAYGYTYDPAGRLSVVSASVRLCYCLKEKCIFTL